jgi:hypothetical protein
LLHLSRQTVPSGTSYCGNPEEASSMSGDALLTKKILKKGGKINDKRGED